MSRKAAGISLITVSALGYGLQPVFGKFATLTFGRFLPAAALFSFLAPGVWLEGWQLFGAAAILAAVFYINRFGAGSVLECRAKNLSQQT